jgi:hypothetical protein
MAAGASSLGVRVGGGGGEANRGSAGRWGGRLRAGRCRVKYISKYIYEIG